MACNDDHRGVQSQIEVHAQAGVPTTFSWTVIRVEAISSSIPDQDPVPEGPSKAFDQRQALERPVHNPKTRALVIPCEAALLTT